MDQFKPKLFSALKTYSKKQFFKDLLAGIIVAIIALPLNIAFALGSGVSPEKGIYAAIIASIICGILVKHTNRIIYPMITHFSMNFVSTAANASSISSSDTRSEESLARSNFSVYL